MKNCVFQVFIGDVIQVHACRDNQLLKKTKTKPVNTNIGQNVDINKYYLGYRLVDYHELFYSNF